MTLTRSQILSLASEDRWFRYWMPYAFVTLQHDRLKHVWLPVNRNYKPLGTLSKDHVDYGDHVESAISFKADPRKLSGIWIEPEHDADVLWLYKSTLHREDYFKRLERLMGLKHQLVGAMRK